MRNAPSRFTTLLLAGLVALLAGGPAFGQERDAYGDPLGDDDPRYDDEDQIRQTVARISEIDGRVSYARGDDPDDWQDANRNIPVTIGDRLYTDQRSRVELQVHGGDVVRLGSRTDFAVLNLTDDTRQLAVKSGVASFRIRRLEDWQVFEVDTPNAAVTFDAPGDYRIDVFQGSTRVAVRDGRAEIAAGGGLIPIGRGEALRIEGFEDPRYDFVSLRGPDDWDRWVAAREARLARARSYEYVSDDIAGVSDLDAYGRWSSIPTYGWVWSPTAVAAGWAPYRVGRWIWQDPWGWTWLSAEPWGWAPYHYGRWISYRGRWCWVPVSRRAVYVPYYPALVAFTGGGPGWSAAITVASGGYVGWFPLAPADPLIPWWGRPRVNVNVTRITYVNRTYLTVVNQNTFVSGGIVTNNFVRDTAVLRQAASAPVLRGTLPLVPTQGAIRVAAQPASAATRPPAAIVARPVVARVAPPPAPPTFQEKLAVIRENRGAPISPAESAQIAIRDRGRPQATTAVRPAAQEPGRVRLAPGSQSSQSVDSVRKPAPLAAAPVRGRAIATADQPVAAAPVAAPREVRRERQQPRQDAPGPPSQQQEERPAAEPRPQSRPAPAVREQTPPAARIETTAPAATEPRQPAPVRPQHEQRDRQPIATPNVARPVARPAVAAPTPRAASVERSREVNTPKAAAPPRAERPDTASQPERPSPAAAPTDRSRDRSGDQKPTASPAERRGPPQQTTPPEGEKEKRGRQKEETTKKPTPDRD